MIQLRKLHFFKVVSIISNENNQIPKNDLFSQTPTFAGGRGCGQPGLHLVEGEGEDLHRGVHQLQQDLGLLQGIR